MSVGNEESSPFAMLLETSFREDEGVETSFTASSLGDGSFTFGIPPDSSIWNCYCGIPDHVSIHPAGLFLTAGRRVFAVLGERLGTTARAASQGLPADTMRASLGECVRLERAEAGPDPAESHGGRSVRRLLAP